MPRYLVKRDTWISHAGRMAREGETVDIDWPPGAEPKKLGDNLELVKPGKAKPDKPADVEPSLA
jgi:hypothetical protein